MMTKMQGLQLVPVDIVLISDYDLIVSCEL